MPNDSTEVKNEKVGQSERTFIEEARRKQIVECAIDALGEHGYQGASLARIAERAGISKGVISYHFEGKEDLLLQIVNDYGEANEKYVWAKVEDAVTSTEALTRYIEASIEFGIEYRSHLKAVIEIFFNLRDENGKLKFDLSSEELLEYQVAPLTQLLRGGQENGEFRRFDAHVMAVCLRGALDNIEWFNLAIQDEKLTAVADELKEIFLRAVREDSKPSGDD